MKRILNYSNFLEMLLERELPDNKLSDILSGMTVAKKIVNFLKRHSYKYEPIKDSKIFVSFKTGDFDTIVPPKSKELGGQLYNSPQGLYCFDMNVFKKRLFGDEEIEASNFSSDNLEKSSNEVLDLGLGYGNHGNVVDAKNLWRDGIPRWLYFVKVKDDAVVISSDKNARFFSEPLMNFLNNYLHYFLKDNESKSFDTNNKKPVSSKKMSFKDYQSYFSQSSDKYKAGFIESLMNLLVAYDDDKERLDEIFYGFIVKCSELINSDKTYMIFTDICQAIGIDGFTQRKGQTHIHNNPEMQSVLLSDDCVEELMKVDLLKELPIDRYVSKMSNPSIDSFASNLKPGDILFDKEKFRFIRFSDVMSFISDINVDGRRIFKQDKIIKVDLSNNPIWKFINDLKDGDSIKIVSKTNKDVSCVKRTALFLPNINLSDKSKRVGKYITETETLKSGTNIDFYIQGQRFNFGFNYDISKDTRESPFFDPELVSKNILVYWNRNKEDLIKRGANWEEYSQYQDVFTSLDELFKKSYPRAIYDDMHLMTFLNQFKEEYIDRVLKTSSPNSLVKGSMTLLLYRGDLSKPIKDINSPWMIWK